MAGPADGARARPALRPSDARRRAAAKETLAHYRGQTCGVRCTRPCAVSTHIPPISEAPRWAEQSPTRYRDRYQCPSPRNPAARVVTASALLRFGVIMSGRAVRTPGPPRRGNIRPRPHPIPEGRCRAMRVTSEPAHAAHDDEDAELAERLCARQSRGIRVADARTTGACSAWRAPSCGTTPRRKTRCRRPTSMPIVTSPTSAATRV